MASAALLLASCPPEAQQGAESQSTINPVISYCGIDGIAELTLAVGTAHGALSANTTVSWSSEDDTLASVAADGAITLKKATANTPVLITAANGGKTASFALTVLATGGVVDVADETALRVIACALDGSYKLTNDITLTKEWTPIGGNNNPFSGTLDGAGFTIKNLFIDKPNSSYVGLIGKNTGSIKDIGVEVGAQGITGKFNIGALAGENDGGSVSGVVSGSGSITATSASPTQIGGLVGVNIKSSATVIGISLVDVSASSTIVGGLVGLNRDGSVIGYATGNISAAGYVGGLVGYSSDGTVLGYYTRGTVSGTLPSGTAIGGLVGEPPKTLTGYSRGTVHSANTNAGNTAQGRLVGFAPRTSDVFSIYYSSKAGESAFTGGTANTVGTGIDAAAQTALSSFTGFQTTDWDYVSGKWPAIKFPADQSIFDKYRGEDQPIDP